MVFENTPSDRVQLVGLGELLSPATCLMCGSGTCEEGYVRIGVFIDYHGEAYFCKTCVTQMAELFGCLTGPEALHLQATAQEYAERLAIMEPELNNATEQLDLFYRVLRHANLGAVPDADSDVSNSGSEGSESTPNGVDAQAVSGIDLTESTDAESVKSNKGSGPSRSELRDSAAIPRI